MNFYESLPLFQDFHLITSNEFFRAVPQDWVVVVTDIKNSRKAIEYGRYKDVNTIGVATIVVARKVLGEEGFPFVFGGDGATFIIPPKYLNETLLKLCDLKELSLKNYGLDLRVGHVSVNELMNEGADLYVARYELTHGECLAVFKGSGMAMAEKKIKEDDKYQSCLVTKGEVDLNGLSCRWKSIPSIRGKIISLLIQADSQETYQHVLHHINNILPEGLEAHNPVDTELMSYKSIWECLKEEWRLHPRHLSRKFIRRMLIIFSMVMIYRYKLPITFFRMYKNDIRKHSDYKKFDGTLRMTLDCSDAQIELITFFLDTLSNENKIKYGIFENESALITCYVEGLNQGEHIHFVDGADGGYASASEKLKAA